MRARLRKAYPRTHGGCWVALCRSLMQKFPARPEAGPLFAWLRKLPPKTWNRRLEFSLQEARYALEFARARELRFPALPRIPAVAALADHFGLNAEELDWFADVHELNRGVRAPRLEHYRYAWLKKPSGGRRLLEAPKERLKTIQRRILADFLSHAPVHDAAHGFRARRSIRTFTAPHVGRAAILKLDLASFFPSIPASRIAGLFRWLGYPDDVAWRLACLCTHVTARRLLLECDGATIGRYRARHLPQGAPTSPALANLCAYRLDRRLAGLATRAGADYARYADDLLFSGDEDFARSAERFARRAADICREEGFAVAAGKTRLRRQGARQAAAGLVLNAKQNTPREAFDELKAILFNCARRGLAAENRNGEPDFAAHLAGRVSFIASVNPARGEKLRRLLNAAVSRGQ